MWQITAGINAGYPYLDDVPESPENAVQKPYPLTLWRITPGKNDGYPYFLTEPEPAPPVIVPVHQHAYVQVYDMMTDKEGFARNGIAILQPDSVAVTHIGQGEWSVTLTHPMDAQGRWRYIRERNILKVRGQLFTIMRVEADRHGSGTVTAYAEHITYQLSDPWLFPAAYPVQLLTGQQVLDYMFENLYYHAEAGQKSYAFEGTSDLDFDGVPYVYPAEKGMTALELLMGAGGLIEVKGGYLFRDNFRFSINSRMEGASENAFDIRIGKNMTGVRRTVDVSTFCTYFRGYDNYGSWFAIAWKPTPFMLTQYPHNIIRSQNFSYSQFNFAQLKQDVTAFWRANCRPVISYEIDIAEAQSDPENAFLRGDYRPGNSGRLYDPILGAAVTLTVTETETDGITGRVTRVTVGTSRSFTRPASYPAVIDIDPEPVAGAFRLRDSLGRALVGSDGKKIMRGIDYAG
jgi:phage minor structural protein